MAHHTRLFLLIALLSIGWSGCRAKTKGYEFLMDGNEVVVQHGWRRGEFSIQSEEDAIDLGDMLIREGHYDFDHRIVRIIVTPETQAIALLRLVDALAWNERDSVQVALASERPQFAELDMPHLYTPDTRRRPKFIESATSKREAAPGPKCATLWLKVHENGTAEIRRPVTWPLDATESSSESLKFLGPDSLGHSTLPICKEIPPRLVFNAGTSSGALLFAYRLLHAREEVSHVIFFQERGDAEYLEILDRRLERARNKKRP